MLLIHSKPQKVSGNNTNKLLFAVDTTATMVSDTNLLNTMKSSNSVTNPRKDIITFSHGMTNMSDNLLRRLKQGKLFLAKMFLPLLVISLLFTTACKEDESMLNTPIDRPAIAGGENTDIKASDIGVLHNDILDYVFSKSFDTSATVDVNKFLQNILDTVNNYFVVKSILTETEINGYNDIEELPLNLIEIIDVNNYNIEYYNEKITSFLNQISDYSYSESDEIKCSSAETNFIINSFEAIFMQNFDGMTHNQEFDAIINVTKQKIDECNAIAWENNEGFIAKSSLSVALNSANYWKVYYNEVVINNPYLEIPPMGIAPWAAADIAGAVGGAVKEVVKAKLSGDDIKGGNVAKGALTGAALGSLGTAVAGAGAVKSALTTLKGLFS